MDLILNNSRRVKLTIVVLIVICTINLGVEFLREVQSPPVPVPPPPAAAIIELPKTTRQEAGAVALSPSIDEVEKEFAKKLAKQMHQDAEDIWLESKRKRQAAIKELGSKFQKDPWGYHVTTVFWDLFTPSYHCPWPVERVGRVGDGGKWVCGFSYIAKKKPSCLVYSYGISWEITYETEILERTQCQVRMFAFTTSSKHGQAAELAKRFPERASLLEIGLGATNKGALRTLETEMDLHGDTFIDILKIDIEGAEFEATYTMLKEFPDKLPFAQLQIELHLPQISGNTFDSFVKWFGSMEDAGLRPFFWEPNEHPTIANKQNYISCVEYSFLNAKMDPRYFYQ